MPASLLITDLTRALPRAAWTDADSHIHRPAAPRPAGGWRVIDYQTSDYGGRALRTSDPDSAVLTIPLEREGWHAVSLGMAGHYDQAVLDARLTGEPWQTLRADSGPVQELPWCMVDLRGRSLEIRYPRDRRMLPVELRDAPISASLFSVRLVPLRPAHARLAQASARRPLVYLNDGHDLFWWQPQAVGPDTATAAVRAFADGDWSICAFSNGGADLVNYPSAVGTLCGEGGWDSPTGRAFRVYRSLRALIDAGHDPLALAIDQAHRQGHPFWLYLRPQAWVGEPPFDHGFRSRFFVEHPEWRCEDAKGRPMGKLSYAFPEVRQQVNRIFAEALARGADGVGIALVRALPLVYWERPLRERFRERHGGDPRRLGRSDSRVRALWGEFATLWLREVRALLDAAGPSPLATRRRLVIIGGPSPAWHEPHGIDIGDWARAGLIDAFLPYPAPNGFVDVAAFAWALEGTGVELMPSLGDYGDQNLSLAALRYRALSFYEAGATGLCRWDTPPMLARLGLDRPDLLRLWVQDYLGPQDLELVELAGLNLREFPPMEGF